MREKENSVNGAGVKEIEKDWMKEKRKKQEKGLKNLREWKKKWRWQEIKEKENSTNKNIKCSNVREKEEQKKRRMKDTKG